MKVEIAASPDAPGRSLWIDLQLEPGDLDKLFRDGFISLERDLTEAEHEAVTYTIGHDNRILFGVSRADLSKYHHHHQSYRI